MNPLTAMVKRRRWRSYAKAFEAPFAQALVAYESVFDEVLSDLYPAGGLKRGLTIDFGWICDLEVNDAFADFAPWVGVRRVRVSVGFFSELQALTNAIFRSCDFFLHLGKPNNDCPTFVEILNGAESDIDDNAPADPLRREAAFITTELALAMIVLHEIGHHALGHVRLGRPNNLHVTESDANVSKLPPEVAPRFQASEIDADRFGFSRVLQLAARAQPPFRKQLVSSEMTDHFFGLAVLAYSLVIALLHEEDHPFSHYKLLTHPHPAVRLYASQLHFAEFLGGHPELLPAYQAGWQESLRAVRLNANQQQTFSLLMYQRSLLADSVSRLDTELVNIVRREVRCYDFTSGRWR